MSVVGWGQKSIAIKQALPQLPGRFISQDLPNIIAAAPASDLCEITAYAFFTPQPVKSPRYFHIRQTLHNWSDDACVQILKRLREAMKPAYTKLLLHEQIVPKQAPSTWTVTQDFNMMTLLATAERTEEQWRSLVSRAYLEVVEVYPAHDPTSESVIEVARAT